MNEFAPELNDVIDILEHFDKKEDAEATLMSQVSRSPRRFHLTLGLFMAVLLGSLAAITMVKVTLPPLDRWLLHLIATGQWQWSDASIMYCPQVPWVILLVGLLGGRFGGALVFGYVGLGLLGVPWFANGGGWDYIYELSLGYLLGFLTVPTVMERINTMGSAEQTWGFARFFLLLVSAVAAVISIHLCGMLVLAGHGVFGHLTWAEVGLWIQRYSLVSVGYDLLLAVVLVSLVRWLRVLFWMILY